MCFRYINVNLFEISNSSIFHKFPSVDCQAIKDERLFSPFYSFLLFSMEHCRYTEEYAKSLSNLKYNATDDDVAEELDDCEVTHPSEDFQSLL